MKKIFAVLMTLLLVFSSFGMTFADNTGDNGGDGGGTGGGGTFAEITPSFSADEGMTNAAGAIVGAIRWAGYIIAVGVIVFIGIKYIMASANEKAELKGLLVKYVIGAALIVFGTQIAAWIFSITTGSGNGS